MVAEVAVQYGDALENSLRGSDIASAATSSARIVYATKTGELVYNANKASDGYGLAGGVFADFRNGLALSDQDFEIGA